MKVLMGAVATAMAVAGPAAAQEAGTDPETMTCIEFIALDLAGQTNVVAAVRAEQATDAAADTAEEADTVEGDAVESDAEADAAGDAMADAGAATEADVGPDAAAGSDDALTEALVAACSSIPDMRVTDAMMQAQAEIGEGAAAPDADAAAEGDASGG